MWSNGFINIEENRTIKIRDPPVQVSFTFTSKIMCYANEIGLQFEIEFLLY